MVDAEYRKLCTKCNRDYLSPNGFDEDCIYCVVVRLREELQHVRDNEKLAHDMYVQEDELNNHLEQELATERRALELTASKYWIHGFESYDAYLDYFRQKAREKA